MLVQQLKERTISHPVVQGGGLNKKVQGPSKDYRDMFKDLQENLQEENSFPGPNHGGPLYMSRTLMFSIAILSSAI